MTIPYVTADWPRNFTLLRQKTEEVLKAIDDISMLKRCKILLAKTTEVSKIGLAGIFAGVFCILFALVYTAYYYANRRE